MTHKNVDEILSSKQVFSGKFTTQEFDDILAMFEKYSYKEFQIKLVRDMMINDREKFSRLKSFIDWMADDEIQGMII